MAEDAPSATAAGRLWGGRFAEGPAQAAWALGRSVHFDARLAPYDLAGSRAHAGELYRIGVLDAGELEALLGALAAIAEEVAAGRFAFAADDEDVHGALERRLIELAPGAGGKLRAGRSRNDQVCSDLRLYLRDATAQVVDGVRAVQAALADQAEAVAGVLAPGYTHLQRAQPVTLSHHLLAHAWALDRDAGRLRDAGARCDAASVLSAGALAGVTLPLDGERYAAALGFGGVAANSMDAVADRDFAVEFLAACALLGVHLSRLCEELVLWASAEFGWVRVADAYSTGSSIMPQKRNPDVAELVRGKTGRLIGDLVTLLVVLKGLPLTYNRDLQEDKEPVFDAVDTLLVALPAVAGMVATLAFDAARISAGAAGAGALATDLAEALVMAGVPFRSAHERVGGLIAALETEGADLATAAPSAVAGALPELDAGAITGLLDPEAGVRRRNAPLGPAPDAVRAQLAALRARLA